MNSTNGAPYSKRKRTTVVTPDKKIQKKIHRNRCDRNSSVNEVEEQNEESMIETNVSSPDEIHSNENAKKDEENQHGESEVSSSSFDNLDRDVIDLTESCDGDDNEKSNTVATKQEHANIATPWESTLSQIMRLSNDEIMLLKDVQADINSSEVKQEEEMESSSAESCGKESANDESDTMKKKLSSESLPDLIPKSDVDEDDESNNKSNSGDVYDSDALNEPLPDLVKSKPYADADANTIKDGPETPKNSSSQRTSIKPEIRRSKRKNQNISGNMQDISDQSIRDDEEMSNEGDEEDHHADYQRDMEIQQNLINIFKDIPRKTCKNADKEWKALFTKNKNRKVVRIRQMRNELSAFYPKSDKHGESISYWDIKNRYIATSSRLVPVDIVERSDENQNQAVLDAIAFLSRPKEELKEHAKNSVFFTPEHKSGTYTRAVNIYRRFCGIIDIRRGRDMGMKAGDIIALMVSGEKNLGRVFFGVVKDSTLFLKSPKACKEMELPATKLFNRTPDPRFNGIILRNVRWMRYGKTRELPRQKSNQVTWLCESAGSWYAIPDPEKNDSMEILSSKEFIDSTFPISY